MDSASILFAITNQNANWPVSVPFHFVSLSLLESLKVFGNNRVPQTRQIVLLFHHYHALILSRPGSIVSTRKNMLCWFNPLQCTSHVPRSLQPTTGRCEIVILHVEIHGHYFLNNPQHLSICDMLKYWKMKYTTAELWTFIQLAKKKQFSSNSWGIHAWYGNVDFNKSWSRAYTPSVYSAYSCIHLPAISGPDRNWIWDLHPAFRFCLIFGCKYILYI